jgi:predicted esterase
MTLHAALLLLLHAFAPAASGAGATVGKQDGDLWKALDDPRASMDRIKTEAGSDPAKLAETLRRGRAYPPAEPGELKERLTDGFGQETDLWIVVPRSYSPERPAGVLIVLHGLGGNGGQAKDLLADFAQEKNFILVCPTAQKEPATAQNEDAMDFTAAMFKHWWSYREGSIPLAALSLVKRRYAIDENRVILSGASMGGFGTWNIGLRYPDRFAGLLPVCGGISRMEFAGPRDDKMRNVLLNVFHTPVYFIHGDQDEVVPVGPERWTRDELKAYAYDSTYVEVPKAKHDLRKEWPDLRKGIDPWLAARVRKPHPAEVKHHAIASYAPQSYWVRIAEFAGGSAEVKASVKNQTITFTSKGAKKITFYLDEKLVDLAKPVRVMMGPRKVFEGKVKPSVDAVLESWRAREDRELIYRASVTVVVP